MEMELNRLLPQWSILPASEGTDQTYHLSHTDAFGNTRQALLWVFPFQKNQQSQAMALVQRLERTEKMVGCSHVFLPEDYWVRETADGWEVCVKYRQLPTLRQHMEQKLSEEPELICLSPEPVLAKQQLRTYWDTLRFSDEQLRQLALQLCQGLLHCRSCGLDNCEISPDTVYLSPGGSFLLGGTGFWETSGSSVHGLGKVLNSLLGAGILTDMPLCGEPWLKYTAQYACREDADLEQLQQMLLHPKRILVPREFEESGFSYTTDLHTRILQNRSMTVPISMNRKHLVCLMQDGSTFALSNSYEPYVQVEHWKDVQSVATGENHTLGLLKNGRVIAVGYNASRQCNVSHWSGIVQIAASDSFSVGLRADGRVVTTRAFLAGVYKSWEGDWREICAVAAGSNFVAGLKRDGTVCVADDRNKEYIKLIEKDSCGWSNIVAISAEKESLIGLTSEGTVVTAGNVGMFSSGIKNWSNIVAISSGEGHTVGLRSDGTVVAAGDIFDGQCDVSGWRQVVAISAGPRNTLALCADGTLRIAGSQAFKQENLTRFTNVQLPEPVALPPAYRSEQAFPTERELEQQIRSRLGLTVTAAVSSGNQHIFALQDGTAGTLSPGKNLYSNAYSWRNLQSVAAGDSHTVGLLTDGRVVCVGENESGQADVAQWTGIIQIAAGSFHTLGLRKDGTVVATGKNNAGQCAVNTVNWQNIVAIAAGKDLTMGLKADGTIVAAGENTMWQYNTQKWSNIAAIAVSQTALAVGLKFDGTLVAEGLDCVDAEQIATWRGILSVALGKRHIAALQANGTVLATGHNAYGQCDVFEWENVQAIFAGGDNTLALHSDGTVSISGTHADCQDSIREQLRLAVPQKPRMETLTSNQPESPPEEKKDLSGLIGLYACRPVFFVQKNGTVSFLKGSTLTSGANRWKNVRAVAMGRSHSIALLLDGSVAVEGSNDFGQCEVAAWRNVTQIAAGDRHTVALCKNGTVMATGAASNHRCDVDGWKNITAIAAALDCSAGLHADGTVLCTKYPGKRLAAPGRKRITAITFAGEDLICLLDDGSLMAFTDTILGGQKLPDWMGLVAIAGGQEHLVGLTGSGNVLAIGSNDKKQCDVSKWTDIAAIYAGGTTTAALSRQGKLMLTGGECPDLTEAEWQTICRRLEIGVPDADSVVDNFKSFWGRFYKA